jgi:hypothetical protein
LAVFIALATPCCSADDAPAHVPFDRLDLVLRLDIEPGNGPKTYFASDDGSSAWVRSLRNAGRGFGIFLAKAKVRVGAPEDDSGALRLEELGVRLITDEYTESGWLRDAQLSFLGEGRARLTERRDDTLSFWRVVEMPCESDVVSTKGSEPCSPAWMSRAPSLTVGRCPDGAPRCPH